MKRLIAIGLFLNAFLLAAVIGLLSKEQIEFVHAAGGGGIPKGNGDVNGDGAIDISDAIYLLDHLFTGGPALVPIECQPPDVPTGTDASDFRTLADYLSHPTVQDILDFMPRNAGSSPPNVAGWYRANGVITATSIPGTSVGESVTTDFCLGPPSGTALEVAVVDPSVISAGALSFIEGSGDLFTVYTAFVSVQTGPEGGTCEQHSVLIVSGMRDLDGSISNLSIGFGVVGLVGDCGSLSIEDLQVSSNSADLIGDSCVGSWTPIDPAKVLVAIENFLLVDAEVEVDGALLGTVGLLSSLTFEADPGFTLSFVTIPPLNGSGTPLGVALSGFFPPDTQPAGRFSAYSLSNIVGDDIFFAPVLQNWTSGDISAAVNVGTPVAESCRCSLAPSDNAQYVIGYYEYDVLGTVSASQANVTVDRPTPLSDLILEGPFALGADSGALSLLIMDTPP